VFVSTMTSLFAGHSTYFRNDIAVKEKLKTIYVHPLTFVEHKITVSYNYNDTLSTAIENQLLRSPQYTSWDDKKKVLIPMYSSALESFADKLCRTVTGLEFYTVKPDEVQWRVFEDTEEIVRQIPATEIPPHIPSINFSDLALIENVMGTVYKVMHKHKTYAMKSHESASQNEDFRTEVEALINIGEVPHVVPLVGVVVQDSPMDGKSYVQGILLKYCEKGSLQTLMEDSDFPLNSSRKDRWAAQIAHGIMSIHEAGLMHGDLKSGNVVVDEFDNANLIDITNGHGFTEGWTSIWDERMDRRSDIYSLGVTLWEMIHDGEDPVGVSIPFSVDGNASEAMKDVVQACVIEDASRRPSIETVFAALGGQDFCGCSQHK